jgi:hypothetical protein
MAIPAFADAHARNQPDLKALIPALGLWSRANDPSFLAHRFIDQFKAPASARHSDLFHEHHLPSSDKRAAH